MTSTSPNIDTKIKAIHDQRWEQHFDIDKHKLKCCDDKENN